MDEGNWSALMKRWKTRETAFDNVTVRSQMQDLNDAASKAFFGEQSIPEDPQDINDLL